MKFLCIVTSLLISFSTAFSAHADVRTSALFSDHAVLQRGVKIHVWGWGAPGEAVSVSLHGQAASSKTDASGRWDVLLHPELAGGPYVLTIKGNNTIALSDVYVGDVWLASGQSNMEYTIKGHPPVSIPAEAPSILAAANVPLLRLLHVEKNPQAKPQDEEKAKWAISSPETMQTFSLIGYLYGKAITEKEHVAVGVIDSGFGGTPIEAWMSQDIYTAHPELYAPAQAAFQKYQTTKDNQGEDENGGKAGQLTAYQKRIAEDPKLQAQVAGAHTPANLYNGMIAPLTGYGIRGALWYQGENDTFPGQREHYADWLRAMVTDWRAKWNLGNFPFIVIQISSFNGTGHSEIGAVRDAQRQVLSLPNTAVVESLDLGIPTNAHPPYKVQLAERVVLAGLDLSYGAHLEDSGPLFREAKVSGSSVTVSFDHADGLCAKGGAKLLGFELAGADGKFVPAEATVLGKEVQITASGVAAPKAVRYGWANFANADNLYNSADLPASTFLFSLR